ncbi:hypothetical protein X975_03404, partial [Stegodyphus mimosarum]
MNTDNKADIPTAQTTRSGRRVHFPQRYVSTLSSAVLLQLTLGRGYCGDSDVLQ